MTRRPSRNSSTWLNEAWEFSDLSHNSGWPVLTDHRPPGSRQIARNRPITNTHSVETARRTSPDAERSTVCRRRRSGHARRAGHLRAHRRNPLRTWPRSRADALRPPPRSRVVPPESRPRAAPTEGQNRVHIRHPGGGVVAHPTLAAVGIRSRCKYSCRLLFQGAVPIRQLICCALRQGCADPSFAPMRSRDAPCDHRPPDPPRPTCPRGAPTPRGLIQLRLQSRRPSSSGSA